MTNKTILKSILCGILASTIFLGVYFLVLTLVSGWSYALGQFATYWYFIISLVIGFGIQIALYQYLKGLVHSGQGMGKVVGVSGTASTAAMISCCVHYLVNLVPILGITGLATFVSQYQIKIFWVGLVFNIFGIIFISNKIIKFSVKSGSAFGGKIYMKKLIITILSIFAFIGGFLIFYQSRPAVQKKPTIPETSPQTSNSQKWETKTNKQANVTVVVTPIDLSPRSLEWKFDISMNTHSVELDQDMTKVAILIDDFGKEHRSVKWDGAPAGGHHREGALVFGRITPYPQRLELKIDGVGGAQQSFVWTLIE